MKRYTKSYSIPGLTTYPSEVFLFPISWMRERQLQRLSQTLTVRCHMLPAALRPSLIYTQELLGRRRRWSWSKCPSLLDQQLEQTPKFPSRGGSQAVSHNPAISSCNPPSGGYRQARESHTEQGVLWDWNPALFVDSSIRGGKQRGEGKETKSFSRWAVFAMWSMCSEPS